VLRVPDRYILELGQALAHVIVVNAAPADMGGALHQLFRSHLQEKVGARCKWTSSPSANGEDADRSGPAMSFVSISTRDARAAARSREIATRSDVTTSSPPSTQLWRWIARV